MILTAYHFRSLHSSQVVRMPVTEYSAEERGTSNTDSYQVFIKDSQGQYMTGAKFNVEQFLIVRTNLSIP